MSFKIRERKREKKKIGFLFISYDMYTTRNDISTLEVVISTLI
jgi:hypothetical protein